MGDPSSESTVRMRKASVVIYLAMLLTIFGAVCIPVFQSHYINPRFIEQLVRNTEMEAIRTGNHMMQEVATRYPDDLHAVTPAVRTYLERVGKDFNLWKIKIFSQTGETIYSTDKSDIGTVNRLPYFHAIVAQNRPHTQMVKKNTESLEGQIVARDVVETYVPMMKDGVFIGAFELYYDVTEQKADMDGLVAKFDTLLYVLTFIIVMVVLFTALNYRSSIAERQRYESRLMEMARKDGLTGLFNRRGFEELLQLEMQRLVRYDGRSALLLLDIDHFKRINDTYGHQAGDDVLAALARILTQTLRKTDIVGRYGGEEFIVFLPETTPQQAVQAAEKLRRSIRSASIPTCNGTLNITVSIGVAYLGRTDETSIDHVIKRADESLYAAKNGGRDRVCCNQIA